MTVADLVGDYLLHGVALKKASTLATDRGRIERHILPLLGDRWVDELQPADVEKFVRDVTNGLTAKNVKTKHRGRAIVRGGGGTAARTVGLLGGIISYGVRLYGLRADNPVQGIKRRKDIKRVRFLSASEFSRLGKALEIAETDGTNPFGVAALRLLLGTGARRGEILSLEWSHVDLERGQLRLPDSKTGEKTIYLSRQMVSLLEQLPRVPGSRFVLPSARSGQHFVGLPKVWKHVCALARLSDLHIHDLRHAFATTAAAEGASLFVIGGLLGHKDPRTTQIYAHLADDTLARAAQLAADKMSSLSDYKTQGG
jgi:integrase